MPMSRFHDEPWYREAEAERVRFRDLMRRSAETCARVAAVCRGLDAILGEARRLLAASRAGRAVEAVLPPAGAPEPDGLPRMLRGAGLGEDDLPELLDGLIAAYRDAVAEDDGPAIAVLDRALRLVGRHLAAALGPRAAGVSLH